MGGRDFVRGSTIVVAFLATEEQVQWNKRTMLFLYLKCTSLQDQTQSESCYVFDRK